MKIYILNIYCLFSCLIIYGQDSTTVDSKPEKINFSKYSVRERNSFYPFNITSNILIVSFDGQIKNIDSSNCRLELEYGLPISNDTICFSKLAQTKFLSIKEIDTLTDILYNTCYRWTITEENKSFCYIPHNAILFLDKRNKLVSYIEVCFDCGQIKYSNKDIQRFRQCDFALNDLKAYFRKHNLKSSINEFKKNSR